MFLKWAVAKSLSPLGYSIARMLKVLVRMALAKAREITFSKAKISWYKKWENTSIDKIVLASLE